MNDPPRGNVVPGWLLLVPSLLLLAMHGFRLGAAPMAGTEPHRILVAQQMVLGEDSWLVPTLYGKPYLRKPPLHYWLLASVDRLAGGASVTTFRLVSVIAAALTTLLVTLFTVRWFSRPAGLVAGFSFVVAVTLWSQSRSADIDSLNTLLSTLVACVLVELQLGAPRGNARLLLAGVLSLAFAGVLLAKGPAGLPVIFGALLGPAVATRDLRPPLRVSVLVPLLLGGLLFAGYALLAQQALARAGARVDTSGLSEAAHWMTPDLGRLGKALLIVPKLLGQSLPLSVFAVLAFVPAVRLSASDTNEDRLSRALACSVFVAWLCCFATLMVNPRYGNVIVPMLCPTSGAIVVRLFRSPRGKDALRTVLACSAGSAAVGSIALAAVRWRDDPGRAGTAIAAGLAVFVAILTFAMLRRRRPLLPSMLTVLALVLLSVPVNAHDDHRARLRSGQVVADALRRAITDARPVVAGQVVFAHPELFHYAGVTPRWLAEQLLDDRDVPADCWLVLDDAELAWWQAHRGASLGPVQTFRTYRKVFHVVPRSDRPQR